MRLTCPACTSVYEVSSALLAGRQAVRCAKCGHRWAPPGSERPAAAPVRERDDPPAPRAPSRDPAPFAPLVAEARRPSIEPRARGGRMALALAWIGSVAVVLLALWAAFAWRAEIMHAWPPSARAYAAFGIDRRGGEQPVVPPHTRGG
ncbi:MAG TPA: zinc-ribbon domain-containing protein [Acetobacteraceae bacterium]|nr:zinc-ribbon domain-containing protein [Acetobacteraceae bacterium]